MANATRNNWIKPKQQSLASPRVSPQHKTTAKVLIINAFEPPKQVIEIPLPLQELNLITSSDICET